LDVTIKEILTDRATGAITDLQAVARLTAMGDTPDAARARLRLQDRTFAPDIVDEDSDPDIHAQWPANPNQ
jgi:hypothetical protein